MEKNLEDFATYAEAITAAMAGVTVYHRNGSTVDDQEIDHFLGVM